MLAVIVATGYGYVRKDGVQVIPIAAWVRSHLVSDRYESATCPRKNLGRPLARAAEFCVRQI